MEPELERRLDQLAQQLGITRSACIPDAISHVLSRHAAAAEARRQLEHSGQLEAPHWSEQVPGWADWAA
ncbi:MAG: hypothetical protein ACRC1L_02370 [Prochlorococcaceae cyanobacterium]